MHKIAVFAAGLTCLFLPMAEAVPITSGFAEITATEFGFGTARFSVTGPGFSFTGRAEVSGLVPCSAFGPCAPGTTAIGGAAISSEDRGMIGTFTFGGETFDYTALPGLITTASIGFWHTFAIPMVGVNPPETLLLTAPFTSEGGFSAVEGREDWNGPSVDLLMAGQGIVTVHLRLFEAAPGTTLYEFESSRYEFSAVPEPGTGTLILPALAGICFFCFRRRTHSLL